MKVVKRYLDTGELPALPEPKTRHIGFALIRFRDALLSELREEVAAIALCAREKGAYVEIIGPAFFKCTFNLIDHPLRAVDRPGFVSEVSRRFGERIAMVHGDCEALVGNIGSPDFSCFGAHIPHEASLIRDLFNLELGEVREIG